MEHADDTGDVYVLKLYISGASVNSILAVNNIKRICDKYLPNKYDLQVIDIHQEPGMAIRDQITALPLLLKSSPLPFKRLIGNMSDTQKVLKGLELNEAL